MSDEFETVILDRMTKKRISNAKFHIEQRWARINRMIARYDAYLEQAGWPGENAPEASPEQVKYLRNAIKNLIESSIELHEAEKAK